MKKKKFTGFTLAEALIAIMIIGVLAAITIPTLATHHQKKVIKSRFKKTYATMAQALELAKKDYDAQPLCYYYNDKEKHKITAKNVECYDFIKNYFFKKLNYSQYCPNKSYEKGCVPDYTPEGINAPSGCRGFTPENIKNNNTSIVLQNGVIIFTYSTGGVPYIGIDINGKDGPNQTGIDVYILALYKDGETVELTGLSNKVVGCLGTNKNVVFIKFTDIMK